MAKKKEQQPETQKVTLKNPKAVLRFDRIGMVFTAENVTWERYQKLISISPSFSQFFNVTTKTNELETKE